MENYHSKRNNLGLGLGRARAARPSGVARSSQANPLLPVAGFTLTELLVSMAIIALLAALLIPAVRSVYASSTDAVSAHVISQLNAAAQSYLAENDQTFWPYRQAASGGTQWWFGYESAASMSSPEGSRWLDLNQGPLGPYIAASGGMAEDPSFTRTGNVFKPKYGHTHFAYGYNLVLQGKNPLTFSNPGKVPVFATCAQVNTFQAPASAKHPMAEEFYYFNTTEKTVHFRVGGSAMVGYANGSAGYLPMMPGTLDSRLPGANIGRLDPTLVTPQ
ncbi:MAG: prepilin-type N-terminal cleavage/methylation domain-containing protein [bacterium]